MNALSGSHSTIDYKFLDMSSFFLSVILLFTLPIRNIIIITENPTLTISWIAAGLFFFVWILKMTRENSILHLTKFHIIFIFLTILSGLSVIWAINDSQVLRKTITFSYMLILFISLTEVYSTRNRVIIGLQAIVLGLFPLAIGGVLQFIDYFFFDTVLFNDTLYGRVSPFGINPNNLANNLVLGVPVAFYLSYSNLTRWILFERFNYIFLILAIISIVLSGSRGAIISLVVVIAYIYLTVSLSTNLKNVIAMSSIIGIGIMALFILLPSYLVDRFSTIYSILSGFELNNIEAWIASIDNRGEIWVTALESFKDNPLLGVGAGNVRIIGNTAHSMYLLMLVEYGLIGLFLILTAIGIAFRYCISCGDKLWTGVLIAWVCISIANDWAFFIGLIFLNFIILSEGKIET